jgi:outer membrane protein OmpA-like peptidoglycan-associated protein
LLALLALAGQAPAELNRTTLLIDTPTADVLPAGSFAISADVTWPFGRTPSNYPELEGGASLRFSPVKRLDVALTAYTLEDYVLGARYQLVSGGPRRLALAVGVCDVGIHSYVSPVGHGLDDAWPDWKYENRPMENFSAFAVTSIPVARFARVHLGLGRGRFVGCDGPNAYLNTDIFFKEQHQWAIGAFGGLEVYLGSHVALCAEASSREANAGIKAFAGPATALVSLYKIEGMVSGPANARFGRGTFEVSYQVDNLFRHRAPAAPVPRVEPAPAPVPVEEAPPPAPPVAVPSPAEREFSPIYFEYDKSDITPEAAAVLRENANLLKSNPNVRVMITGRASEEGPLEYNFRLAERRAAARFEYLKSLGVPAGQMSFRSLGEEPGKPYELHRRCYFEILPEK